jgi:hypothetical protein
VVAAERDAEGFDYQVVVLALGEAGDGDGADDAGGGDLEREAAPVGGIVGVGQGVFLGEGGVGVFEMEADGVGAAVEAGDGVGFSLDPAGVVGGGTGEGGVEEGLVGLAEAADVDGDGVFTGNGEFAEDEAEAPGGVSVEVGEEEFLFLEGEGGEVVWDGHGTPGGFSFCCEVGLRIFVLG